MIRRDFLKLAAAGTAGLALADVAEAAAAIESVNGAPASQPVDKASSMRGRIELGDNWLFQPDPWGEGEARRYFDPAFDASLWQKITVPRAFDTCVPGMELYEGRGW